MASGNTKNIPRVTTCLSDDIELVNTYNMLTHIPNIETLVPQTSKDQDPRISVQQQQDFNQ